MFIIYSMPGCNYCRQVKQLMELTEQKHVVYTLDEDFTIEEFESNFNISSAKPKKMKKKSAIKNN